MSIDKENLDNTQDFRDRYLVPEHFLYDPNDLNGIWYFKRMRDILNLFDSKKKKVLDFGCGDGFFSKMLLDAGFEVTGVDYNKRAILFAQAINNKGEFLCKDVRIDPIEGTYDQVAFIAVLEHIAPKHQIEMLKKIDEVLNDDGNLIITVPSKFVKVHKYHYIHYNEEDIVELLRKAGFIPTKVIYHNRYGFFVKLIYNWKTMLLIKNKFYDLKIIRCLMRLCYEKFFSLCKEDQRYQLITILAKKEG